jgi:hypothetical protein
MIANIIKESKTKSEAIKKIFGYDNGKSRLKFNKLVVENNIDITHLLSKKSKYDKVTKECPVCGEKFETKIGNKEKTTCSYSCSNKYFRSGKNNPNYDENKTKQYRTICFNYHKKECIICGETNIVGVHHYDENNKNNLPENLVPLCPTHHQYVHSAYKDLVINKVDEYVKSFKLKNNESNNLLP